MLHHAELPKSLWGEAVLFAVWLKNRTTTKALGNMTPFEKFNKFKPDLSGVPEWGQQVWAHSTDGTKLDAQGVEVRWVGYDEESPHTHHIYWPTKCRVSVEHNIKFTPVHEEVYLPPPSVVIPTAPAQPLTSQTTTITPGGVIQIPSVPILPSLPTEMDDQSQIWIPGSSTGISAQTLVGTSPSKSVTEGEEKEVEEELEQHVLGALTPEERAPLQVVPAVPKKPAREMTPEAQPP